MSIKLVFSMVSVVVALSGCASYDLRKVRQDGSDKGNKELMESIRSERSEQIAEDKTYYTDKLKCILSEAPSLKGIRVGVSPIYDKTGKIFPSGSTSISDIIINSLSYSNKLNIVEIPMDGELSVSRVNFLSEQYRWLDSEIKNELGSYTSKTNHIPLGLLFPTNYHVAGALVQYDESVEVAPPSLRLDLDSIGYSSQVDVILIGLHLRLVNSNDGEIQYNSGNKKRGSVLLYNKYYKINTGASFYKIINAKQYGLDHSITVADPKQYAVREMIEAGLIELFSVLSDKCSNING